MLDHKSFISHNPKLFWRLLMGLPLCTSGVHSSSIQTIDIVGVIEDNYLKVIRS